MIVHSLAQFGNSGDFPGWPRSFVRNSIVQILSVALPAFIPGLYLAPDLSVPPLLLPPSSTPPRLDQPILLYIFIMSRNFIEDTAEVDDDDNEESFDEETGEVQQRSSNRDKKRFDDSSEEEDDDDDEEAAAEVHS